MTIILCEGPESEVFRTPILYTLWLKNLCLASSIDVPLKLFCTRVRLPFLNPPLNRNDNELPIKGNTTRFCVSGIDHVFECRSASWNSHSRKTSSTLILRTDERWQMLSLGKEILLLENVKGLPFLGVVKYIKQTSCWRETAAKAHSA